MPEYVHGFVLALPKKNVPASIPLLLKEGCRAEERGEAGWLSPELLRYGDARIKAYAVTP